MTSPFSKGTFIQLCGILIFLVIFYGIPVLTSAPFGIHYIRQTDSLSFISYFKHYSYNLFEPGVLDLRNAPNEGKCAGEFPVIYWIFGIIERLIDLPVFGLKWFNLLLVAAGHYFLFRTLSVIYKNGLLAAVVVYLVFGSGIVAYYSCNYLPDAAVYGLVLIGWSRILPNVLNGKLRYDRVTLFIFFAAGLIKAPASMHLLTLLCMTIISWRLDQKRVREDLKPALFYLTLIFAIAVWHFYARWYNASNNSSYFMTWAEPIWEMTANERDNVTELTIQYWWTKYLHPTYWHVLLLLSFVIVFRAPKLRPPVLTMLVSLVAANISFVLLFYRKFADHDYYFLTIMPLFVIITVIGVHRVRIEFEKYNAQLVLTVLLGALSISALVLAHTEVGRRLNDKADSYSQTQEAVEGLYRATLKLKLPIDNTRIIVQGDSTTNGALNEMERFGWSYPGYPNVADAKKDLEKYSKATHFLLIEGYEDPISSKRLLVSGGHWSFWEIIQ